MASIEKTVCVEETNRLYEAVFGCEHNYHYVADYEPEIILDRVMTYLEEEGQNASSFDFETTGWQGETLSWLGSYGYYVNLESREVYPDEEIDY